MPGFSERGDTKFVSYITGPSHVRLGLELAQEPVDAPEIDELSAVGGCEHGPIDVDQLREAVLAGISSANAQHGSSYGARKIVYVANDSPRYDLFQICGRLIVERVALGLAFHSSRTGHEFQRDQVDDMQAWSAAVVKLRRETEDPDAETRGRALGRLGDLLRIDGRIPEAIEALEAALDVARECRSVREVRANTLRLAIARQYGGALDAAQAQMEALLDEIEQDDDSSHLDFVLQHLGKVYAEQEKWQQAVDCFRRALELRRGVSTEASSESALQEALSRRH